MVVVGGGLAVVGWRWVGVCLVVMVWWLCWWWWFGGLLVVVVWWLLVVLRWRFGGCVLLHFSAVLHHCRGLVYCTEYRNF